MKLAISVLNTQVGLYQPGLGRTYIWGDSHFVKALKTLLTEIHDRRIAEISSSVDPLQNLKKTNEAKEEKKENKEEEKNAAAAVPATTDQEWLTGTLSAAEMGKLTKIVEAYKATYEPEMEIGKTEPSKISASGRIYLNLFPLVEALAETVNLASTNDLILNERGGNKLGKK